MEAHFSIPPEERSSDLPNFLLEQVNVVARITKDHPNLIPEAAAPFLYLCSP